MTGRAGDFGQPIPGYEVLELLGAGGMSSVYKARQSGLDRLVAVKVIRRDQLDPRTALARLKKEAQMLSRLDHPGIVRSIDFGEAGDLVYFVMELVEGRSGKELLAERGRLPLREVLKIGEEVALALDHAASHGVVHRDVKPGNLLLARDGSVKLTDFGLARGVSDRSLTQAGITVGTPQYMSPEQVKSPKRVDLRSDLYSLGATLYQLATGRPPFDGENVGEILHEVLYGRPQPPEQFDPALPPAFSRVLARLLARDPARRYPSGAALIEDLERVRAGLKADAKDDSGEVGLSWQDAGAAPPFRWMPWTLLTAGVVIAVATGGALWHPGRGAEPAPTRDAELRAIADLSESLRGGSRPAAEIAREIVRLKQEGVLTKESATPRAELESAAFARFSEEVASAVRAAGTAATAALGRGDFAGARRAFDASLAAACDRLVPDPLRATLPQSLPEYDVELRRAGSSGLAHLESVAEGVRKGVASRRTRLRDSDTTRFGDALERLDFVAAKEQLDGESAAERRACAQATREALAAAGIQVATDASDDELAAGWPETLAAEIARDPIDGLLYEWGRQLDDAKNRCEQETLRSVNEARARDLSEVDDDFSPEKRNEALRAAVKPRREALLAAGAPVAKLDAALDDHRRALENALAQRRARQAAEALALLFEGDGEHAGFDELLRERRLGDARARLASATALSDEDRARWSGVVDSLDSVLTGAEAGIRANVGKELDVRRKGGVKWKGVVTDEGGGAFRVGAVSGLRSSDLSLDSLLALLPAGALDDRKRLLATFYFGDEKARPSVDAALADPSDPLLAHLKSVRDDERAGADDVRKRREVDAAAAVAALNDALASRDAEAADAAWTKLNLLRKTEAARPVLEKRDDVERKIKTLHDQKKRTARNASIAAHASERVDDPEAGFRAVYDFANPDQGLDFGLAGNDVTVQNGRMRFAGGEAGKRAHFGGPRLPLPFDRKQPWKLVLDVRPSVDAPGDPPFFAIVVGSACVLFYRPDNPKGESFPPQLTGWMGTLTDEEQNDHTFTPNLGMTQPPKGRFVAEGLERGRSSVIEVRWTPSASGGEIEIVLDGRSPPVFKFTGALTTPPDKDAIELRCASALEIETLSFEGRLR
jgi:tRNA A-37 threonylcarbamoyl transferase component Bud32